MPFVHSMACIVTGNKFIMCYYFLVTIMNAENFPYTSRLAGRVSSITIYVLTDTASKAATLLSKGL